MIDFTDRERRKPHVNLSALIDVAFILVIFIVLTATFRPERDMEIELPETNALPGNESEGLPVVIFADGRVEINGVAVSRDQVLPTLEQHRGEFDSVLLTADRGADVQAAVEVMADARLAGFEAVAIATTERGR